MPRPCLALLPITLAAVLLHACSDRLVDAGGTPGGTGASASTGGSSAGGNGAEPCTPGLTQCTDCVDNDVDGFSDAFDIECVGPLDDDESSFSTAIPGDNRDPCKQDCFFDGNSGQGDDKCEWHLECDPANPGAPECPYDAASPNCPETQHQQCIELCLSKTPNGCDCFGCCEVELPDATTITISIGSEGCTDGTLDDPEICKPCTQVADCSNDCQPCEYCFGKLVLPPSCQPDGGGGDGGGANGCEPGVPACDKKKPCPAETPYCLTGCCIEIPS